MTSVMKFILIAFLTLMPQSNILKKSRFSYFNYDARGSLIKLNLNYDLQ